MAEEMNEPRPVCVRYHAAVELIGARWSGAILGSLFTAQRRYADIKASIPGVSDTMLAQRLRELETAGLIERQVLATSPVRVEYQLTPKGRELRPVVDALVAWSHKWIPLPTDGPGDTHADSHEDAA